MSERRGKRRMVLYMGEGIGSQATGEAPRPFKDTVPLYPQQIAACRGHIAVLANDGSVHCAGVPSNGRLGRGDVGEEDAGKDLPLAPVLLEEGDTKFRLVRCGQSSTAAVSTAGDLYHWGYCFPSFSLTPQRVDFPLGGLEVLDVALGTAHYLAVCRRRGEESAPTSVYSWGNAMGGALGTGEPQSMEPRLVPFFEGKGATAVFAGSSHSGVIAGGRLYVFGEAEYRDKNEIQTPQVVELPGGAGEVDAAFFGSHTTLVASSGVLYGWGSRLHSLMHRLGHEGFCSGTTHTIKHLLDLPGRCVSISGGDTHFAACTEDGAAFWWGERMGPDGLVEQVKPAEMPSVKPCAAVACTTACLYVHVVPPIFRVTLEQVMLLDPSPVPQLVEDTIQLLSENGRYLSEGIFRLSGAASEIKRLGTCYDTDYGTEDLAKASTDSIAGLLKLFLRQLPVTLIPAEQQAQLRVANKMHSSAALKVHDIYEVLGKMKKSHFAVLVRLLEFLRKVADHSDVNKMTVKNLVMCMLPSTFGQSVMDDIQLATENSAVLMTLIKYGEVWRERAQEAILQRELMLLDEEADVLSATAEYLCEMMTRVDMSMLQEVFLHSGCLSRLCRKAVVTRFVEAQWEAFNKVIQFCTPMHIDSDSFFAKFRLLVQAMQQEDDARGGAEAVSSIVDYFVSSKRGGENDEVTIVARALLGAA